MARTPSKPRTSRKKKDSSTVTSADTRTTYVQDPDELPTWDAVAEAITTEVVDATPVDTLEMAPIQTLLAPLPPLSMLDEEDEIVQAVRQLMDYTPELPEQFFAQAHRVKRMATRLRVQQRRIDMLLAELALYVRSFNLWRYFADEGIESEAQFWAVINGTPIEKVNQLIDLRTHVVPMLHEANVDDKKLENASTAQAQALIQLAKQATRDKKPAEQVKEHVETILAASDSDLRALQQMSRGVEEKQPVGFTLTPRVKPNGQRGYLVSGWISEEQAQAMSSHNFYHVYSVGGEAIHITRLADTLREWEPVVDNTVHALPVETEASAEDDDDWAFPDNVDINAILDSLNGMDKLAS